MSCRTRDTRKMVFRPGNTPHNRTDTPEKLRERFYGMVRVGLSDECWGWTGQKTKAGYGRMVVRGQRKSAHRVSFEIHHGEIDLGMVVCHSCDNPICVNPGHLFQGTPLDNRRDCTKKSRHVYGDKSPNAVLSEQSVRDIKAAHKAGTLNQREASRKHGVSWGLIGHIVHGRAWAHIQEGL